MFAFVQTRKGTIISAILLIIIVTGIFKSSKSLKISDTINIYAVGIDQNIIYTDMEKEFDITVDSFLISQNRIKRNENLAKLLYGCGVDAPMVDKAIKAAVNVFDIRKIKAGNNYRTYYTKDTSGSLKYFVYVHSPTEYLKIRLNDNPVAELGTKEIVNVRKTCTGTVASSLWETMMENNIDPMMAIRLSEIYAWTVDFFGLEKGDQFKIIYDEQYVDSLPIGIGEIYAAEFTHRGEQLYAFLYEQDNNKNYFDEKGKNLRRQFLKAPLRFSRISSGYSNSRMHPILKIRRPHRGVDYSAPTGTPIYSIGDGTVIAKGYTQSAGYYIKVRHNSVYTTGYNHISKYPKGIAVGQRVKQGQVIGYVGATGYATGPHLDFRMWKNNQPIDPLTVKAPPVDPIKENELEKYQASIESLIMELSSVN